MLDAISTHIRSYLTKIGQCTLGDTGQTGDGGKVKIENGVAVLEPMRNRCGRDDPSYRTNRACPSEPEKGAASAPVAWQM